MSSHKRVSIAFFPLSNGDNAIVLRHATSPEGEWYVIQPQLFGVIKDPAAIETFIHLAPVVEKMSDEDQEALIAQFRVELNLGEGESDA